jgi:hypothetical protein
MRLGSGITSVTGQLVTSGPVSFPWRHHQFDCLHWLPHLTVCLHGDCVQDPEGKPKKASIRDNQDGTYLVSYVPDMTGRYTILIKYGGDEIPYSPYRIRALPTGDASKCTVTGNRHTHSVFGIVMV